MTIHFGRSKITTTPSHPTKKYAEDAEIETVSETIYLGQLISLENKIEKEKNGRITLAWQKLLVPQTHFQKQTNSRTF